MPMEVRSKCFHPHVCSLSKTLKANVQKFFSVAALTALEIWCLAMIGIVFLTLFAYAAILVEVNIHSHDWQKQIFVLKKYDAQLSAQRI